MSVSAMLALTEKRAAQAAEHDAAAEEQAEEMTERPRAGTPPKIHRSPGFKLLSAAEFLFSAKTYSEVLEPTLRDLRLEHIEALAAGRIGKARWVKLRGYFSFWSAIIALTPVSLLKRLTELWKAIP